MPSVRSTIIVLALATAAVIAAWWTTAHDLSPRPGRPAAARLLLPAQLPIDDVTRINLRRRDGQALVFARVSPPGQPAQWMQMEPFEFPMDAYSMRQLAAAAAELQVFETIEPGAARGSMEAAGFHAARPGAPDTEPPADWEGDGEITYEWPGGQTRLELGRQGVAARAFLRVAGRTTVYVVGNALHERALETDPREWRDRRLFQNVGPELLRIEREEAGAAPAAPAARVILERQRRQWRMIEPVQTRVDPQRRDQLLDDIGRAVASGFILDQPGDLGRFGLAPPAGSLTIVAPGRQAGDSGNVPPAEAARQRLLIGSRIGAGSQDRFGMIEGRPTVLRLPAAALKALFPGPHELVEPTGSGAQAADVKTIVIRSASGDELKLERDLEKWRAPDLDNREVKAALAQELLDQLTKLRAASIQFAAYPRELEAATVTLYGFDAKPKDTVRIARQKDSGYWILENGDHVLRLLPPGVQIRLSPRDFNLP